MNLSASLHPACLFLVMALSPLCLNAAELKLSRLFSDHMVLQRDKPVPVWGWANANEQVTVSFADQRKTAMADSQGHWVIRLDAMQASEVARELTVQATDPARKLTVTDVLVGEVWLGSGQSNMAMAVNGVSQAEVEKAAANWPQIRMFKEESTASATAQAEAKGQWAVCTPANVGTFSATLYFFGRELHRELRVPIGLINSSVGGTPIESWVSAEAQAQVPELKTFLANATQEFAQFDADKAEAQHQQALAKWRARAAKAKADGTPVGPAPKSPVAAFKRRGGPGGLFNGKIAPLIPYAIRGVVWYQGESAGNSSKCEYYQYQLPALIDEWRQRWGEELPFAWVQLPNYVADDHGWAKVREAMLKTLRLPNTGMAITIDIGEPKNIHPRNKQDVGQRLALWALGQVYHRPVPQTSGPLPTGHEVHGNQVIVTFKHADGLRTRDGESVNGFFMAGEDQQWRPADAKIDGNTVIVSCSAISKPSAVRYAWFANPQCNLINAANLPASPFRTDDWPK